MIMSGNEAWKRNGFKRWRKVDRDGADITLSGKLFQMVGPATGKARPPTVDSLMDSTSRRLERRPGRLATWTSWLRYDGAVLWVALYMSTDVLNRTLSRARNQWVGDVVRVTYTVDEPCCRVHQRLKTLEQVGRKTSQDSISVAQPGHYQWNDKSLERSRWHWLTNWT